MNSHTLAGTKVPALARTYDQSLIGNPFQIRKNQFIDDIDENEIHSDFIFRVCLGSLCTNQGYSATGHL